jgi:signal transduction histidine kinase
MTPSTLHPRLLRIASALVLGVLWAACSPWLAVVELPSAIRPWLGVTGGVVALASVWRPRSGPKDALALATRLAVAELITAGIGAVWLTRVVGITPALALGLCGAGSAVVVAALLGLVAAAMRDRDPGRQRSAPLRSLISSACSALVIAAWALASGHVLGQRHADTQTHAAAQARDLVAVVNSRSLLAGEPAVALGTGSLAATLCPAGGFLVTAGADGRVRDGEGLAVGTRIRVAADPRPICRTGILTLPCATRRLPDGTAIIAAVPPLPIGGDVMIAFALVGILVALGAWGIGRLTGAATAEDLERVCKNLDDLGRGPHGLDSPVVAASLDEVGDLAVALGRLRTHLRPTLAEYETALEKAQQADRARTAFLGLVSAELRLPLDQIVAGARGLLDPVDPLTAEQAEDVRIVLSSSLHLVDLIDEVLDVSAIATGQVPLKLGDVDIGQVVSDVAKAQRPLVQQKRVEVRLEVQSPSPRARADERRLRQVFTNIISNAAKFTEHGFIEVIARSQGGEVEVSVRDTGPGIDPKALPRLFTEFVQLGSLKQRAHGTGLGLAICKRLVEAHGGKVSAESTPGEGSVFRVVVPVAGPASPAAHAAGEAA